MRYFLLYLTLACALVAQVTKVGAGAGVTKVGAGAGVTKVAGASGGSAPTLVNSGSDLSGATTYTTTWSPANGNTLVLWIYSNSNTSFTVADGEGTGNTYVADGHIEDPTNPIGGRIFSCHGISGTGAYTFTVTGATTPAIAVLEVSGSRTLAGVGAGTNPSSAIGSTSPFTPSSFTTTDANVILFTCYGSLRGGAGTLAMVDGSFTIRQSANDGSVAFVGGAATRIVTATGTFTGGWTDTAFPLDFSVVLTAGYK